MGNDKFHTYKTFVDSSTLTFSHNRVWVWGPAARALQEGCDLGVAFDGDGGRCVFVDDQGRSCKTEKILITIAKQIETEREKLWSVYHVPQFWKMNWSL